MEMNLQATKYAKKKITTQGRVGSTLIYTIFFERVR